MSSSDTQSLDTLLLHVSVLLSHGTQPAYTWNGNASGCDFDFHDQKGALMSTTYCSWEPMSCFESHRTLPYVEQCPLGTR